MVVEFSSCFHSSPPQKGEIENKELSHAAKNGVVYTQSNLIVITENNVDLISINENTKDTLHQSIHRGSVLIQQPYKYAPNGFRQVILPGDSSIWFLANTAPYYRQYATGMRFPVQGTVKNKNTNLHCYDPDKKIFYDLKLEVDEPYYWIILKDGHLVNILRDSSGHSITGVLNEKHPGILQKEDHLKIVPDEARKKLENVWR